MFQTRKLWQKIKRQYLPCSPLSFLKGLLFTGHLVSLSLGRSISEVLGRPQPPCLMWQVQATHRHRAPWLEVPLWPCGTLGLPCGPHSAPRNTCIWDDCACRDDSILTHSASWLSKCPVEAAQPSRDGRDWYFVVLGIRLRDLCYPLSFLR